MNQAKYLLRRARETADEAKMAIDIHYKINCEFSSRIYLKEAKRMAEKSRDSLNKH